VPYLQIDLDRELEGRVELASALARAYATVMEADEQRISVAFRRAEVLRCFPSGPRPVIVVTCEIRSGREPERLPRLAGEIARLVSVAAGVSPDEVVVYFTQHRGIEIYRDGAPSADWAPPPAA
jgi:phenylpyruvate tautomerase PptA (4-oxalocrotonate tautomerase family)